MSEEPIILLKRNIEYFYSFSLKFDNETIRYFPLIKSQRFHFYIKSLYVIQHENLEKGLILFTKPNAKYLKYGCIEASIIVFSEYRNKGLAKLAVKELNELGISAFFKVRKNNATAFNLFNKIAFRMNNDIDKNFSLFTMIKY